VRGPRPCCALALAVAGALTGAAGVAGAATPLPARDPARSVYDTADVIAPADEASLEAIHRELYAKAEVAIVVVTIPRLVDETIEDFAVRVGQTWGVGKRGSDRGLVIAFSRDDRKIFVATGYGTEGYLPDGRVGDLLDRHAMPALRAGRYSEGLTQLDRALAAVAAHEHGVTLTGVPPPSPPIRSSPGGTLLTIIGIAVLVFLGLRHPWLLLFLGGGMGGRGRHGRGGGGFGGFGGGGFGGGGAGRDF
jgi:uncharacterized protein